MKLIPTPIADLYIVKPQLFKDSRGYFFESYNQQKFKEIGIDMEFVQDNESFSEYGVIRGLHYQLQPYAQTKLVRAVKGTILDVVVDIRKDSPTYGQHFAYKLNDETKEMLLVPQGFAHGFSVLSPTAVVAYKCDNFYHKESERGIRFDDPTLNINWRVEQDKVIVSEKDMELPFFQQI